MRCNPWRWLWGLIPIAMLSWIAFNWERNSIEADLARRAQEALGKAGLGWAETSFSGRDALLTGRAYDDGEPKRALDTARGVWGVRVVEGRTDLIPKVDKFGWGASLKNGRLALSGHVPSEEVRRTVLGAAKSSFPQLVIDDAMQLARGAPPQDIWLGGIDFGLRQLAQLSQGNVDLEGTALSLAGEAVDASAYKSLRAALGGKLPAGIKLAGDNISPPQVKVFAWSAKFAANQLLLSGHVPSERAREELFMLAKKRFGKVAIVDRMETAAGAPDGWPKAAAAALDQLAYLDDGVVSTRANQLSVSGMARDEGTADTVRKGLKSQVPATFKTSDKIQYREVSMAPTDYSQRWKEAEARWAAIEESRPRPPESKDDGEAWWKAAQKQLAAARPAPRYESAPEAKDDGRVMRLNSAWLDMELRWGSQNEDYERRRLADEERDRAWREREERWAAIAAEHDRRRAAEEARNRAWREREEQWALAAAEQARRKADEEARRLAWMEAEERWAADAEAYRRRQIAEDQKRMAAMEVAERRFEADKCQVMMQDVVKKGKILFKTGSADLDNKSAPTLNSLAKVTSVCPRARVEISGHTDSVGSPDKNLKLSEKRAQSIVAFLSKAGVDTARLTAIGYGQTRPIAPNDTAENKSKNRRIEFAVIAN